MLILATTSVRYEEIVEVWESSVRATHDFLNEEDIRFFRPLILNEYLDAVTLCHVEDERGRILGFVGVAQQKIEMLFVAPDAMGRGVGKALLLYAVEQSGASKVDVNEQNPKACGFYEHMGFRITGRSELDGMGKPFPLLHMSL